MIIYWMAYNIISTIIGYVRYKNDLRKWKRCSLFISIINMIWVFILLLFFNNNSNEYQYRSTIYINDIQINFGLDGINISLLFLTTVLFPILFIIYDKKEKKKNILTLLILEFILILIFYTIDMGLFFIFFEISLIPLIFFIGSYGASPKIEKKLEATYRIYYYTFIGSILMLISFIFIQMKYNTFYYELLFYYFSFESNFLFLCIIWLLLIISISIKIPLFPFHNWLPFAHSEASTRGSVILAGIILKLGSYAIIRFILWLFPVLNNYFSPFIYFIAIFSVLFGSLITIRQIDLKVIIAYSSIVHMAFSILGFFSMNHNGLIGSFYTLFSHAWISGALFILIGMLYNRYHSRILSYYRGLSLTMPIFSIYFIFFAFANMSFPLTASFIGEILIFYGIYVNNIILTVLAGIAIYFSTVYMLNLTNRLLFGSISPFLFSFNDLSFYEFFSLFPLFIFTLLFGINSLELIELSSLSLLNLLTF